jgi:hypothetical protein
MPNAKHLRALSSNVIEDERVLEAGDRHQAHAVRSRAPNGPGQPLEPLAHLAVCCILYDRLPPRLSTGRCEGWIRPTRCQRWPLPAAWAVVMPRPQGREGGEEQNEPGCLLLQLEHFPFAPVRFTRRLHRPPPAGNSFPYYMT